MSPKFLLCCKMTNLSQDDKSMTKDVAKVHEDVISQGYTLTINSNVNKIVLIKERENSYASLECRFCFLALVPFALGHLPGVCSWWSNTSGEVRG